MTKKNCIVLDVDVVILNTAFLCEEIFELKLKGDDMWDYFHAHCNSDRVKLLPRFEDLFVFLYDMKVHSNIHFILLTSRNEKVRKETEYKLRTEGVFFDNLIMRPEKDYREASVLKKEALQELQKEYNIIMYVDDDLNNCEAAKELGIYALRKV